MTNPGYCVPCSVMDKTGMRVVGDLLIGLFFVLGLFSLYAWPFMLFWLLIPVALMARGVGGSLCTKCNVDMPGVDD